MTRETFPKFKKGDIITNGEKIFLFVKTKNVKEYDEHNRGYWSNGFLYIDYDGIEKFQQYADSYGCEYGEYSFVKHSSYFDEFLKLHRKELKVNYDKILNEGAC